mgnify:CR=1 FL=1
MLSREHMEHFHSLPPDLKALLNRMLYIDQARRPTIHEVAAFPWITEAVPAPADPATAEAMAMARAAEAAIQQEEGASEDAAAMARAAEAAR